LMEVAWQALEDAGYDPYTYPKAIGIFAGGATNGYLTHHLSCDPNVADNAILVGNNSDFLVTKISHKLNLRGPAYTVQCACSTTLVAVCQACQTLLTYQADMALAGGVAISLPQRRGYQYIPGGMASPDGHCRPFDAKAQGTLFGAGAGLVLLKRLEDALDDGDHIYAVIRGFGVNNDGASKVGYAAPSVEGQAEAIAMAHALAGIPPETIAYHEAHGTATPLGDPIEIAAATKAFRAATAAKNFCALGSAKANIGHLDTAAGIAGLIKAALTLKHAQMPPLLNFENPNPALDLENSPFYVNNKLTEWKRGAFPRRASVSSFGVGGTNAHAVLEEAPAKQPTMAKREPQLLVLSAKTATALDASAQNLAAYLRQNDADLADVAHTLQIGRHGFEQRQALVAATKEDAIARLESKDLKRGVAKGARRSVVFMFPGQGAQYCGMGVDLYRAEPEYRRWMDECAAVLNPLLPRPLLEVMYPQNADDPGAQTLLTSTQFAQPALFASEYALARLWMSWGIEPQAMIGHSVGEFVAACLAGVFSLSDALQLVAMRGRMVQEQPRGSMLAVRLPENETQPLLGGKLSIAAINTPGLCVISGPDEEVAGLETMLKVRNIVSRRLHTSHAFHSSMMDAIVGPFTRVVESVDRKMHTRRYISTVTGTWVTAKESVDANYWAAHLRQTVRFADGMKTLFEDGASVLLEVGPGNTLSNLALQHPGKPAGLTVVSSLSDATRKTNDVESALDALGRLWSAGVEPSWTGFHSGESLHRVSLPTYPFERKRYWVEPRQEAAVDLQAVAAVAAEASPESGLQPRIVAMFADLSGMPPETLSPSANFLELGFDSLFLTQVTQEIDRRFAVNVTFRQLAQSESSIEKLAVFLQGRTPVVAAAAVVPAIKASAETGPVAAPLSSAGTLEAVMQQQLASMMDLMSRQLETLRHMGLPPAAWAAAGSEFERRLALTGAVPAAPATAEVAAPITEAPVTEAQMEIILASELNEEVSCAFNESVTVTFDGTLDIDALRYAVRQVTARHDGFRMTLSWSRDFLRFLSDFEYALPFIDLTDLPLAERASRLRHVQDGDARTPFDLVKGPLARFQLVKLDSVRHALIFTAHHILCDGWSINVVVDELGKFYSARVAGENLRLPSAPSFAAYAKKQSEESFGPRAKLNEKYWLGEFPEFPPDLDLPGDRPRAATRSHAGATYRTRFSRDTYRQIKDAGARRGCSLFVTLLSGFEVLLSRLGRQNDIVVGIPTAGQALLPKQNLVGHCVHFLPLRAKLAPEMNFSDLLAQQKQKMLDAYDHQHFTYGTLVGKLGKRPDLARLPLTEVRFNLDRVAPGVSFRGIKVQCETNAKAFVNFDLVLNLSESDDGLVVECEYSTGLYEEDSIARWVNHYQTLLLGFASETDPTVSRLPLLGEAERRKILTGWNATEKSYPRDQPVHALFERQAAKTPDAIAAAFEDEHIRYTELDRRSNQLARHLAKIGAGPGQVVGIYMDRSLEMLVALLGTLKAGAAYLPLDPSHPRERIDFVVAEAKVPVLLTQSHLAVRAPKSEARVVCLDGDWELIARESDAKVPPAAGPKDIAYLIYTSGSTGKPKGVEVPHGAVVNLLCSMAQVPGMTADDTLLAVTTLSFDIAALELFLPLIVGAKVVIASREVAADPVQLMARLESCGATLMQATPVTWRMMLDAGWNGRPLAKMLCGGEALPRELATRLLRLGPSLWNMYGPTETTIWSSTGVVEPGEGRVPIGPPIANTQFYILDPQDQPVPIGVPGELCIAGDGVARGYFNRAELTQERFVADPFRPGGRMYRTGDLARYWRDGAIDFLGRLDHQVKLRGYRIELGEIESVLAKHPQVAQAVVAVREDEPGDQRLVAYIVTKNGTLPSRTQLRAFAADQLPDYMVPSRFVELAALPLTANGKIDRKALPKPDAEHPPARCEVANSRAVSSAEEILLKIFSDVLKLASVTPGDSLLDLGADSIQIFQIATRANHAGFSFTPREILQQKTVENLCLTHSRVANKMANARKPLQPVDRERYRVKIKQ
jgi:amino acid adenylation domain-containing protein